MKKTGYAGDTDFSPSVFYWVDCAVEKPVFLFGKKA